MYRGGSRRRSRKKLSRVVDKQINGDALTITADGFKYSEVLKAIRSDAEFMNPGADVCIISRTRTRGTILELRKDSVRKGPTYLQMFEG